MEGLQQQITCKIILHLQRIASSNRSTHDKKKVATSASCEHPCGGNPDILWKASYVTLWWRSGGEIKWRRDVKWRISQICKLIYSCKVLLGGIKDRVLSLKCEVAMTKFDTIARWRLEEQPPTCGTESPVQWSLVHQRGRRSTSRSTPRSTTRSTSRGASRQLTWRILWWPVDGRMSFNHCSFDFHRELEIEWK